MRKRILSLILALALLAGMVPAGAAAPGKGEILSFDLERTEYTAALGTIQADLGLPALVKATVREQVTTVEFGEEGQTVASTATEERETEIPVTWTCDDYQLAMEGTYTFTAHAEGYALADGAEWPSVTVKLEHQLARPWANAVMPMANGDNVAYVSDGATGTGALNDRAKPYGTLAAAIAALTSGGTIYVMGDLTNVGRPNIGVTKDITIATDPQAGGAATLWTSGTATLFDVSGGATLTIQNLILDGGGGSTSTARNAFIIVGTTTNTNVGHLVLGDGAVIRNCVTSFGVVWTNANSQTSVTIEEGAVISGNTATNRTNASDYYPGNGAGVTLRGGTLTMNGGKITGNTAQSNGGGVYVAAGATFNMSGGQIGGNVTGSGCDGGGVYMAGGTFNMTGGEIVSNTAQNSGGGVYMAGGSFTMSAGAEISGNVSNGGMWAGGGGVRVAGGTADLGGTIANNDAHDGGGVLVYAETAADTVANTVATISGYVTGNTSTYGAGVYVGCGTATLDGATIIGNASKDYGGGAFLHNGEANVMTLSGRLTILDNISHAASAPEENNLLLFSNDTTPLRFQIKDLDSRSEIGVTHVNTNTWKRQEGGFAFTGKLGSDEAATAEAAAREALNAFRSDDPEYAVTTILQNYVAPGQAGWGLALSLKAGGSYYVSSTGSDTGGDGSRARPFATLKHAIDMAGSTDATIYVMDDIEEPGWDATSVDAGNLTIETDPEADGRATVYITTANYLALRSGAVTLKNIVFDGSRRTVTVNGSSKVVGLFQMYGGTLILEDGAAVQSFTGNTAVICIPNISGAGNAKVEIRDGASVTGNKMVSSTGTAGYPAGGGAVGMYTGTLLMSGGTIDGNTAPMGAAVYMSGGTFTMSEGAVISGNKTIHQNYDGVVRISGGTATLNGTFTGNDAQDGGAVLMYGADAEVTIGGTITGNTSNYGAVYLYQGTAVLDGAKVTENTGSNTQIGGVYVRGQQDMQLSVTLAGDTVIRDNTGSDGAAANLAVISDYPVKLTAALEEGAEIGVRVRTSTSTGTTGIFAGAEGSNTSVAADSMEYFFSDVQEYAVLDNEDGTLSLGYPRNNYYVSATTGNDSYTGADLGTPEHPYKTIHAAYNAAAADSAFDDQYGAVIHIMDEVTVDRVLSINAGGGKLTITGTGPNGEPYVDEEGDPISVLAAESGKSYYTSNNIYGMLQVSSTDLTIDHLTLQGDGTTSNRAIRLNDGTLNLGTDAVITGWYGISSAECAIYAPGGTVAMSGNASVTDNTGGGIWLRTSGTLSLSGAPVVNGNTVAAESGTGTVAKNVWLNRTSTGGNMITVTGALDSGAAIGLTDDAQNEGVVFAESDMTNAAANLGFFFSDDGTWSMVADRAALEWTNAPVAHNVELDRDYTTLQDAVNDEDLKDGYTIEILRDITVVGAVAVEGKKFTLTSDAGHSYTVSRDLNFPNKGFFFTLTNGAEVTLENITIDGAKHLDSKVCRLFDVNGSKLVLEDGAVLQNARGEGYYGKGAIYVHDNGEVEMYDGAVIQNCEAGYGAAVTLYHSDNSSNKFTMYGGTITGNHSYGRSFGSADTEDPTFGAVHVGADCTFTMLGGTITGNTGDGAAMFEMYRDAGHGAGINMYGGNATVILSGDATVTGNTFTTSDGAVIPDNIYIGWSAKETGDTSKSAPNGKIVISGEHTGQAGVGLYANIKDDAGIPGNASGYVFGEGEADGETAPALTGSITSDVTAGLVAVLVESSDGTTDLMWRMNDLYVSSEKGDDTAGLGTEAAPYATLEHAISQAAAGATIHIMDAVTVKGYKHIYNDLRITGTNANGAPYRNAALIAGSSFYWQNVYGMLQIYRGTVTMDNLTLNGADYNTRVARVWENGALELEDVTATGWGMGVVHINGSAALSGEVTFTGNGYGVGFGSVNGKLTLSGTVVIEGNGTAGGSANVLLSANRNTDQDFQIVVDGRLGNGSSIGVTDAAADENVKFAANEDQSAATANLNKFFADNGQDIAANQGEYLVWGKYVARIIHADGSFDPAEDRYYTLQAALDAVLPGETVELMADTAETAVVIDSPFAALDWAGHTLTGTLTVAGGGSVGVIRNTVNGAQNFVTGGVTNEKIPVTIQKGGTVGEIAGGRYQETAAGSPPGSECVTVAGTLRVISGGWFTGVKVAVCLYGGTSTVITGGVFDAGTEAVIGAYQGTATLALAGGYFGSRGFEYASTLNYNRLPVEKTVSVVGQGGITAADVTVDGEERLYHPMYPYQVARTSNDNGQTWTYYETLAAAVAAVDTNTGVASYVEVLMDLELNETISTDRTFTLRSYTGTDATYTIARYGKPADGPENPDGAGAEQPEAITPFTGVLFSLTSGANVTFEDLVVDGGKKYVTAAGEVQYMVSVASGAALTLENGAVLQNNACTKGTNTAGAVWVNGTMTMKDGAVIRWNEAQYAAAIAVNNGKLNMEGGQITGNYATRFHNSNTGSGAIHVWGGNAAMDMSGGSITGNGAADHTDDHPDAGGVVFENGTLTIRGDAVITGNYLTANRNLTSGSYTSGTAANLTLAADRHITLGGNFTGSVGVTQWPREPAEGQEATVNISGAQFGLNNTKYTGAEHFFNDVDSTLSGVTVGTNMIWGEAVARTSNDGGATWAEYATLDEAITAVDTSTATVSYVEILQDITQPNRLDIADKTFTLRSSTKEDAPAEPYTILVSAEMAVDGTGTGYSGWSGSVLFRLTGTANVTFADVVLDGNKAQRGTKNTSLIRVFDQSAVTLSDGAVLQNTYWNAGGAGAGVFLKGGGTKLTMEEGAVIRWNEANYGAAVTTYVNNSATSGQDGGGTFTMTGGQIYGNYSTNGAVYIGDDVQTGLMVMTGGSITGNGASSSAGSGAGVYLADQTAAGMGKLQISGNATITGNYSGVAKAKTFTQDGEGYTSADGSTASNLVLEHKDQLTLTGSLTGSVGVTGITSLTNTAGEVFGKASGTELTGVGNFTNDVNSALVATQEGTNLKWAAQAVARTSNDGGKTWTNYATLQEAVNAADSDPDTVTYVELLRSIDLTAGVAVSGGRDFVLRSGTRDGDGTYIVKRGAANALENSTLFALSGGAHVTVTDLVVDGNKSAWTGAETYGSHLFTVTGSGASLTLEDGAILQNNRWKHTNGSGTVYVEEGGALTMEDGAVIRNNEATYGAAVTLYRHGGANTFTMNGGTITGNVSTGRRSGDVTGAVYVGGSSGSGDGFSTFTMAGGTITGNTSLDEKGTAKGAGVTADAGTTIFLSGDAVISGNTVGNVNDESNVWAGNVFLNGNGTLNAKIELAGNFTGTVGVAGAWSGANEPGGIFGLHHDHTGAGNFSNDVTGLTGTIDDKGNLVWADGNHLYVATWGNDETGDGTRLKPYRTITRAALGEKTGNGTYELGTRRENADSGTYSIDVSADEVTIYVMDTNVHFTDEERANETALAVSTRAGTDLTIKGDPQRASGVTASVIDNRTASLAGNYTLFSTAGGSSLTLEDVTFDGQEKASRFGLYLGSGALTLGEGSVVTRFSGNPDATRNLAIITADNSGTIAILGGQVVGNTVHTAGAVNVTRGSAALTLSGDARVTGNTTTTNEKYNIVTTGGSKISLTGPFTGAAGVRSTTTSENAVNAQFGLNSGNYSGAGSFTNDAAALQGVTRNGTLVWNGAALYVASWGSDTDGNGTREHPYQTITGAAEKGAKGTVQSDNQMDVSGSYTIYVMDDKVNYAGDKSHSVVVLGNLTIMGDPERAEGVEARVTDNRSLTANPHMFNTEGSGHLTLLDVTFDGNQQSGQTSSGFFWTNQGTGNTLTLGEGSVVTNFKASGDYGIIGATGSSVNLTVELSGGQVIDNTVNAGGAIELGSTAAIRLNVSGGSVVTGNMLQSPSETRTQGNVITNHDTNQIYLAGDFTGTIGVYNERAYTGDNDNPNLWGAWFGTTNSTGYAGVENFYNDGNFGLVGEFNGTTMRWLRVAPVNPEDATVRTSNDNGSSWEYFSSLAAAVRYVDNDPGTVSIVEPLVDTVEVTGNILVMAGQQFTLRSGTGEYAPDSGVYMVQRASGALNNSSIFTVRSGGSVTVENLTIDGNKGDTAGMTYGSHLFALQGGSLTLNNGATLQNNRWVNRNASGAVFVTNGGSMTMEAGSVIQNCEGVYGAAVSLYINAENTLTMNGGEIRNNHATGRVNDVAGAVFVGGGSTLTMSGDAAIKDNTTDVQGNGAGVSTYAGAVIELTGGAVITGNTIDSIPSNLYLRGDTILTVRGELTGQVGITDGWAGATNATGEYFGLGINASGLGALFNDRDPDLDATLDGGRVKWDNSQVAMIVGGRDNGKTYSTLAAAIADYDGDATHIVMIANSTEAPITVDKTVYVDLDGYTVTADVKVNVSVTFYGFDTKTNGFDCTEAEDFGHIVGQVSGAGKLAGLTDTSDAQTGTAMRYVKITDGTDTSFHRYDSKLGTVVFRPSVAGIYFRSEFYGDQWVKDALRRGDALSYGLFLGLSEDTVPTDGFAAAHDPEGFQPGAGGNKHQGSMVQYIVMETMTEAENEDRTNTPIYVSTYFNFDQAGVAADILRSVTLTKVVELAAQQYNAGTLDAAQTADFEAFWEKFSYLYPDISVTKKQDLTDGGDEA